MANRAFNFEVHTGQNRFAVASGCEHSMLKNCVRTFVSRLGRGICLLPQAVLHCARDSLIFRSAGAKRNLFTVVSFYKHLAPNGAKSHKTLLYFKVESATSNLSFTTKQI